MSHDNAHASAEGDGAQYNSLRTAIESDLRALHLDAPTAAIDKLASFLGLMQKWNAAYNLTAVRDLDAMRLQHLADCLAVMPSLRRHAKAVLAERHTSDRSETIHPVSLRLPSQSRALRVLDVGSGGGLPGVVLAVMQPDWEVHCIDAVAKKTAFVRQVAGELQLPNLHALHGRIETLQDAEGFDVIVSRAFASLKDFVAWSRNALAPQGVWVAMKGRDPEARVGDEPARGVRVTTIESLHPPGLHAERCLVWMTCNQTSMQEHALTL